MLSADPPPNRYILCPNATVVWPLRGGGIVPLTLGVRQKDVSIHVNSVEKEGNTGVKDEHCVGCL